MTIRLRLTIYWAAVLAAILLVAAIAAVKLFERQQFSALDAALLEEAENTADQIERSGAASATGILQRLSLETDIGPGRRVPESSPRMARSEITATSTRSRRRSIRALPTHPAIVGNTPSGSRSFR